MAGVERRRMLVIAAAITLSACGTGGQASSPANVEQTAVGLVVQTFEAATRAAGSRPTGTPSAPTPTLAAPRLYLNTEVGCRSGIGSDFKILATLPAGTMLEMVGKSSNQGAWLVRVPNSSETCWVHALDASPSGDFQFLPEVTPRPPSGTTPVAPSNLGWPFYCTYVDGVLYEITIKLTWTNNSPDANGFRVYRQDVQIADLPAALTTYTDIAKVEQGTDLTYSIEAYNDAGPSSRLRHTIARVCK